MHEGYGQLAEFFEDRLPLLIWYPDQAAFPLLVERLVHGLDEVGLPIRPVDLDARISATKEQVAALLPGLGQVHLDLSRGALRSLFGEESLADQSRRALDLVREIGGDVQVIVDLSSGRMEGPPPREPRLWGEDTGDPWWLESIYGRWPMADYDRLGEGVGVAVIDHPVQPDHPALAGRVAPAIEAWRMPHYPQVVPQWDDHGTGSAGLVAGRSAHGLGVAPACHLYPVHVTPGPALQGRPDRIRMSCRAIELIRRRQLDGGGWAPLQVVTQQVALTGLDFVAGLSDQYETALFILEAAYSRAAGTWGLALVASAGSHPKAHWPVPPAGLAGVWSVGAIDDRHAYVRRSAHLGVDLAAVVSKDGLGPWSCAAGGGLARQGQATSAAAPLAAGTLAALISIEGVGPRRALRWLRKEGLVLPGGASKVCLEPWALSRTSRMNRTSRRPLPPSRPDGAG
ncbi:MAG: S8 family serine peptidase [Deltaproteobacteria bacterium]|nr:S8 family serine peptidase [Deltaproteobacteria bacterium]